MVLTTKALLDCTLEYYKDEDEWRTPSKSTKTIAISELLRSIVTVEHIRSSYKSHVMCIIFDHYSILIDFKSRATMESWVTKINNIRGTYMHTVFFVCSYIRNVMIVSPVITLHCIVGKFGELSEIHQTKTIQSSSYY